MMFRRRLLLTASALSATIALVVAAGAAGTSQKNAPPDPLDPNGSLPCSQISGLTYQGDYTWGTRGPVDLGGDKGVLLFYYCSESTGG